MARALQLARRGEGYVSPNPMVGAVIVCDGRIIGEGYHRRYGSGHAEVNAVASVADSLLLRRSTVYVTLEPCAHYGKTPPCAELLVKCGVRRVVVGTVDPFAKVSGRGIDILRRAGIEVTVGVLEKECRELNRKFMTAHSLHRPFILLKWACSADGYLDRKRSHTERPEAFSTAATSVLVHRLRTEYDAVAVGAGTVLADNPSLTVRHCAGRSPRVVVFDRHGLVSPQSGVIRPGTIYFSSVARTDMPQEVEAFYGETTLQEKLGLLYGCGITSLMVEGGASLIRKFTDSSLWDSARIEVGQDALGDNGAARLPIPEGIMHTEKICGRTIITLDKPNLDVALKS